MTSSLFFFFSSRRRHTRSLCDWSSDVCSSDLDVRRCIDAKPGHRVMGASLVLARERAVLVADTAVTEMPDAQEIAEIGRASCRERGAALGGLRSMTENK